MSVWEEVPICDEGDLTVETGVSSQNYNSGYGNLITRLVRELSPIKDFRACIFHFCRACVPAHVVFDARNNEQEGFSILQPFS